MQLTWEDKRSDATVERYWFPDVPANDGLSSVTASASGITVTAAIRERFVVATVSDGVAETPGTVTLTLTTDDGLVLTQSFRIGIRDSAQLAATARDVVYFAMKKIAGRGEDPEATELDDGLEVLNAMLMEWRIDGLDLGIGVLSAATTLAVPDEFLTAIKYNLRVLLEGEYGSETSAFDARMAVRGKDLVANRLLNMGQLGFLQTNNVRRHAAYDGSF